MPVNLYIFCYPLIGQCYVNEYVVTHCRGKHDTPRPSGERITSKKCCNPPGICNNSKGNGLAGYWFWCKVQKNMAQKSWHLRAFPKHFPGPGLHPCGLRSWDAGNEKMTSRNKHIVQESRQLCANEAKPWIRIQRSTKDWQSLRRNSEVIPKGGRRRIIAVGYLSTVPQDYCVAVSQKFSISL